ncbi:MAG: aspartate--tRNA ligase [Candidatus Omnitrophica bacterium]|nr:aspartate--tRNA ligase [Candidatus Omnitrophota bacterium]
MLRTHTCGELNKDCIGKEVTLCGWVDSRRDHGKLIFIDLRDRYGKTQIVFLPKPKELNEQAKRLRSETVVKIVGEVNERPKGTVNENISTGYVELLAKEIEILNQSEELPFAIEDDVEAGEEVRLTHRYLDLRRKIMKDKIIMRHNFNQAFRSFLNGVGFLEIETPYLSKSTPEGARDYLVPSRLNPNKFYALPQSPQILKQLLMVSGFDKYYQIVRCFRDEDLRKDRQPEFTQLDLEMSFIEQEDIFRLMEEMIAKSFKDVLGVELKTPFPRMLHSEAKEKYNSDKPDIREDGNPFAFLWVVDFPLFEYNDDNQRWQSCHHPFTCPHPDDLEFLEKGELEKVRSCSYDLVFNGEEIGSGSIRIHSTELQSKIFQTLGISEKEAQEKFGFLLRAFKYGAPPHGGIALGLDRLYTIVSGSASIREVIAFPKTQKGICPLSEAPSTVSANQLKELFLDLVEKEET